jgi:hypothetical protein
MFSLPPFGGGKVDTCSIKRCAAELVDTIGSATVDELEFHKLINTITREFPPDDKLKYPLLAAVRATAEAYRHIYPRGSREQLFFDLTNDDYRHATLSSFAAWLVQQQNRLRRLAEGESLPMSDEPASFNQQSGNDECVDSREVFPQMLDIDQHGWGQRSIIMISGSGVIPRDDDGKITEMPDSMLRTFCDSRQPSGEVFENFPWRDMADRIRCFHERVNRDRWLILYAMHEPLTGAQMGLYARGIAQAMQAGQCLKSGVRVLVVNFLRNQ